MLFDSKLCYKFIYPCKVNTSIYTKSHEYLVSSWPIWRFISQYLESTAYEKLNYISGKKINEIFITKCIYHNVCQRYNDYSKFVRPPQLSFQARKCEEIYSICISVLSLILKKKVRLCTFSPQFVKFISQFQYSSCDMWYEFIWGVGYEVGH